MLGPSVQLIYGRGLDDVAAVQTVVRKTRRRRDRDVDVGGASSRDEHIGSAESYGQPARRFFMFWVQPNDDECPQQRHECQYAEQRSRVHEARHPHIRNSTRTVSIFVYQEAFSFQHAGMGASAALMVVLISAVLISTYVTMLRRQSEIR